MTFFSQQIFFSFFALIFFFFSITGLGVILNNKVLKIQINNFYENFIIGIFFIILYLQVHIIFLPINLLNSFILFALLLIGQYFFLKEIPKILNIRFLVSLFVSYMIILNANVYPYFTAIYDYGLYHNTYINWLNQENITLGLANLHMRFGYSGSSYLIGAFFNFYPYFNTSFVFSTSIFFVFLIFLFLSNIKFKDNNFSSIFNILIIYVVLKYILVESLGDVSPDKITSCIIIYIFYNFIKNFRLKNRYDNNYLISLLSLTILISLSASTWVIVVFLFIYLLMEKNFSIIKNIPVITLSIFLCLNFALLNFLKSGNIFYPVIFNFFETSFVVNNNDALFKIKNFPKGYPVGTEWIIPKLKNIIFLNNYVLVFCGFLISLIFLSIFKKEIIFEKKKFLKLLIIINLSIIIWFLNAPDLRFAKIYFWLGITLILSFYFEKFIINKFYPILYICIFTYCFYSSFGNLAYKRSFVEKNQAIEKFKVKKIIKINSNDKIFISDLNYSNEKFSIPEIPENIENLTYEKNFFSKIYFKK